MLTFTHTYLLNLAYQKLNRKAIPDNEGELIFGNVLPDFITHLGRTPFQAMAHNLPFFSRLSHPSSLEWGAIFHILCDNFSTLGKISFEGNYHKLPKYGFIEKLAQQVVINITLQIPKRRILQCAFDIFVIRENRQLLISLLKTAEDFLQANFSDVIGRMFTIIGLESNKLVIGLQRFSKIYGKNFIEQAASAEYRLFPLVRSLLNLDTLTNPRQILEGIQNHPELMELVELNMELIKNDWHELLEDTVVEVMKYPGIKQFLKV
jgi:hypothetical protein